MGLGPLSDSRTGPHLRKTKKLPEERGPNYTDDEGLPKYAGDRSAVAVRVDGGGKGRKGGGYDGVAEVVAVQLQGFHSI